MRRTTALLASLATLLAVSSTAAAAPKADDPSHAAPSQVLVGFKPDSSPQERERAAAKVSGKRKEKVSRGGGRFAEVELVDLPAGASNAAAIAELERDPAVAYAEANWRVEAEATSNDSYFTSGSLWGMYGDQSSPANQYGSQAAEAWAADHTGSKTAYVGVIDEGIQYSHPDLDANVWTNPFDPVDRKDNDRNGYRDDKNGWDFYSNNNTIYDGGTDGSQDKHGTHVTGTIGAEGGNTTGVVGVNWNVTYISGKFLGPSGGYTSDAIKAVDYFTDLKTRHRLNLVATSNSWGGGGYSQGLFDAIERANAQGILFVAAAGNGGSDRVGDNTDTSPHYPSSYTNANIISVAAIDSSGGLASFSNYGAASVDLGAPGVSVNSTLPYNKYGAYSGTSMATPHVTGAAALYASTHPGATATEIKGAILASAVHTPSLAGKTATGGRLDAGGF